MLNLTEAYIYFSMRIVFTSGDLFASFRGFLKDIRPPRQRFFGRERDKMKHKFLSFVITGMYSVSFFFPKDYFFTLAMELNERSALLCCFYVFKSTLHLHSSGIIRKNHAVSLDKRKSDIAFHQCPVRFPASKSSSVIFKFSLQIYQQ